MRRLHRIVPQPGRSLDADVVATIPGVHIWQPAGPDEQQHTGSSYASCDPDQNS